MRAEIKKVIDNSKEVQVLLNNMKIVDSEILEIIQSIKQQRPNVKTITFKNNQIGDEGAKILADELVSVPSLAWLDMQLNQIDKSGMMALFTLRAKNPGLKLDLYGNKVTDAIEAEEMARGPISSQTYPRR